MAPSHTEVRRTEAEIMEAVAKTFERAGYEFAPMSLLNGVGVEKYLRADPARKFREYNPTFPTVTIPYKKGKSVSGGASVVTARAVRGEWSVEGIVKYLIESGDIDKMIDEQAEFVGDRQFAMWDVTYSIYIVAKGWVAEQQVDAYVDDLIKMGESHDVGGIDFQTADSDPNKPEYRQLRPFSWAVITGNADETDQGIPVIYYGWCDGELILSDDGFEIRRIVSKDIPVDDYSRNFEYIF